MLIEEMRIVENLITCLVIYLISNLVQKLLRLSRILKYRQLLVSYQKKLHKCQIIQVHTNHSNSSLKDARCQIIRKLKDLNLQIIMKGNKFSYKVTLNALLKQVIKILFRLKMNLYHFRS